MASPYSKVFRATGLPAGKTASEVESMIYDLLEEDEKRRLKVEVTLIPSCEENDTSSGIIEFAKGHPKFLSPLASHPNDDWAVQVGDVKVNFNLNFRGFTQLYATQPTQPVSMDIIAITSGDAYESLRGGSFGLMWLRHFCSEDFPNCRTMIYGYNSALSSNDSIMDYGSQFLDKIKSVRYNKELRQRPIVFVAHSLGGTILVHCLIKAFMAGERGHPAVASLHESTYGIFFFGTPHQGMFVADIQRMIGDDHPRQKFLRDIMPNSDILEYQLKDFKNIIQDRKIVSFYETGWTRELEMNPESKCWARTGAPMLVVDSKSAVLGLPENTETEIPADGDHDDMPKFAGKNHRTYKKVLRHLRAFEGEAAKVVSDRFCLEGPLMEG